MPMSQSGVKVKEIFSRLSENRFVISLDLKDMFWQIPLDKASKQFYFQDYCSISSGPSRLDSTVYLKLTKKVILAPLRHQLFVYLDDVVLIPKSFDRSFPLLSESER